MGLTVLLGGARSGKSALAVELAEAAGRDVVFIATAEARDAEMADRIGRHRSRRPATWHTVDAPVRVREAVAAASVDACVIVDCLALWAANLLEQGWDEDAIAAEAAALGGVLAAREAAIVVTNEVGMGIVPATPLGRSFRDLLGRANVLVVREATAAYLVVAGRGLALTALEQRMQT
jgi:adenosylcobinamide kinase/adenosylcobinamide-phosphate guanylyltransferase